MMYSAIIFPNAEYNIKRKGLNSFKICKGNAITYLESMDSNIFLGIYMYKLSVVLSDSTGGVEIIMLDRAARTLLRVTAQDLYNEVMNDTHNNKLNT